MKTLKSLFVGALVALLGTGGLYAQSSFNEDGVVKIDRHNMRDFREGEIIVKFKPKSKVRVRSGNGKVLSGISRVDNLMKELGVSSSEQLMPLTGHNVRTKALRTYTGQSIKDVDMSKLYRLKIDKSKKLSVYEAVERFKELPEVEYAEPNYLVYSMAVEDQSLDLGYTLEPLFNQLWGLTAINMPLLWNKPKIDEKRPVIAIIDTGVDITHPDLADNIWTNTSEENGAAGSDDDNNGFADDVHGWDFVNKTGKIGDWNGHGTHCAGIAAAVGGNGIGIVGVNPDALIMSVTVMQSDGVGDVATIIKGIDYASANGADVLSMSFGGYAYSIAEEQALAKAYSKSVLVAAAGNDCLPINHVKCPACGYFGSPMFPAAFTFVLGVEATEPIGGQRAGFSNYDNDGPVFSQFSEEQLYNYELKAPGVNILSSFPGGTYKTLNGTSMACPLAAGAISRLMQCKEYASWELMFGDLIHTMKGNIDVLAAYNIKDSDRKPELTFVSYRLDDTEGGDGDGRPDSGETIKLYPVVRNAWGQAENVKISLEMGEMEDASLVEFITPTADFGKPLSSYGKNESQNPIVFKINDKCVDGRNLKLILKATCDNISSTASQEITLNVENGVEIGGFLEEDMTLYPDVHYIITDKFVVPDGFTLTIKPGTKLEFKDGTGLLCGSNSNIICKGTPDSLIVFTSSNGYSNKISELMFSGNSIIEYVKFVDLYLPRSYIETNICLNCIFEGLKVGSLVSRISYNYILAEHKNCVYYNNECSNVLYYSNLESCNLNNNIQGDELVWYCPFDGIMNCNSCNNFTKKGYLANVGVFVESPKIVKTLSPCYFGSSLENIARIGIMDACNPLKGCGIGKLDVSEMLAKPSAEAHGIVWKVVVNGYDAQDQFEELPPLGVGKQKFEVYFNRPMDTAFAPNIYMGVRPPYTQNRISEEGSWSADSTIYTAYLNITGKTATDGLNRIYVDGAKDMDHFEIPFENYRFNVQVAAAGSLSTGLMAEPGLGKVTLNWITDEKDFEDLLGYNIYRYTEVPDSVNVGTSWDPKWEPCIRRDTVLVNKQLIDSKELSFVDYEVVPGTTYYYNIKQMTTSLTSYDLSNTVAATPLTATKGDANGSMAVDVADVVTEIAYLTNQNPQPFIFEAADVNSDKNINILDIVGTVGIITQPTAPAIASVNNETAHYSIIDGTVCLETPVVLGGVQLRIKAKKGSEISAMTSLNGFEQVGNWLSEDEYIFLAYSMSGKTLSAGKHELLHIGSDFTVTEVVLSDRTGNNVKVEQAMSGAEAAEIGSLSSPWPNPFSTELHIPYQVSGEGLHSVQIQVTDIARIVANYNVQAEEGSYEYTWRPNDGMSEGTYMVSLTIDGKLEQTVKSIYKK